MEWLLNIVRYYLVLVNYSLFNTISSFIQQKIIVF